MAWWDKNDPTFTFDADVTPQAGLPLPTALTAYSPVESAVDTFATAQDVLDYVDPSDPTHSRDPATLNPVIVQYHAADEYGAQSIYIGDTGAPSASNPGMAVTRAYTLVTTIVLNVSVVPTPADPILIWNGRKGGGYPLLPIAPTALGTVLFSFGNNPLIADQGVLVDPGGTARILSGAICVKRRLPQDGVLQ